jgi:hypothetical protein
VRFPSVVSSLQREGFEVEYDAPLTSLFVSWCADWIQRLKSILDWMLDFFPLSRVSFLLCKELAVDKVLAVYGRAEARDSVDLFALEQYFKLEDLFGFAAEKDRGFDLRVFADMTRRAAALERSEFNVGDSEYRSLLGEVERWRDLALGLVRDRDRGRGHGHGHGHGLER